MAMKSWNRSPSPMSSRTISRNAQEHIDTDSRSFSSSSSKPKFTKPSLVSQPRNSNLVTPANNPYEYSVRNSLGKDGVRNHEQKENEQDPNSQPARPRSPWVVKGAKNFMSPTISAASKINASPRKKVLGERNEAVRTSASLSSGKFSFYSLSLSEAEVVGNNVPNLEPENCHQAKSPTITGKEKEEFQIESTENLVAKPTILNLVTPKDNNEPESDTVVLSPDIVCLDSSMCTERVSHMSPIAPLDVDPRLPPYDPQSNYLSPRPQFLHYKPKPRDAFFNHGISLEDEFASEISSEAESTTEEVSQSNDSGKIINGMARCTQISESSDSRSDIKSVVSDMVAKHKSVLESVESDTVAKLNSGFLTWRTAFMLILVLSLAFALANYSPSITDSLSQEQMISNIRDDSLKVIDFAKEHFEGWYHNLKLKSVEALSHAYLVISDFREVERFSSSEFLNLTVLQEHGGKDYVFEQFPIKIFNLKGGNIELYDKPGIPQSTEENNYDDSMEAEYDVASEEHVPSIESQHIQPTNFGVKKLEENSEYLPHFESIAPENLVGGESVSESSVAHKTELLSLVHSSAPADLISEVTVLDNFQVHATEQQSHTESNHEESKQVHDDIDLLSGIPDETRTVIERDITTLQSEVDSEETTSELAKFNSQVLETQNSLKQSLPENIMAIGLTVATLMLPIILLCLKQRIYSDVCTEAKKPTSKSPICERSHSGPEAFEMEGESCSSQISDFQSVSTYYSKRRSRAADEAQSHGKNARRNHKKESLTSTSSEYTMGSPSYGSFTTYSIVHSKNGDEEVVTPLRRSSRIRNKVTP